MAPIELRSCASLLAGVSSVLAIAAGSVCWRIYQSFQQDMGRYRASLESTSSELFVSDSGYRVQYAVSTGLAQESPVALVLHASGGGFDQGLVYGRMLLPEHTLIAVSRQGYLKSTASNASSDEISDEVQVEDQCRSLKELLDNIGVSKLSAVLGMSIAGVAALKFVSCFPNYHVESLVLVSPWVPFGEKAPLPTPPTWLLRIFFGSNFVKWASLKLLGNAMSGVTESTTFEERETVARFLETFFPAPERFPGFLADIKLMNYRMNLDDFRKIQCPILYVAAEDDSQCKLSENHLPAELADRVSMISRPNGGHMLIADYKRTQSEIQTFYQSNAKK